MHARLGEMISLSVESAYVKLGDAAAAGSLQRMRIKGRGLALERKSAFSESNGPEFFREGHREERH